MDITLQTLAAAVFRNTMLMKTAPVPEPLAPAATNNDDESDRKVSISLIRTPRSGMKGLVRIRQQLELELSIGNMLSQAQQLPFCLLEDVSLSLYRQRCAEILDAEDCIELIETASGERISPGSLQETLMDLTQDPDFGSGEETVL